MKKLIKNRNTILILGIIIMLTLGTAGLTYAWFSVTVTGNDTAKNDVVETGELSIVYTNGEEIRGENIVPGWSETKTFTVENTGTATASYKINWENLINEFVNKSDLTYEITSDAGGSLNETMLPNTGEHINIIENISIEPEEVHTYKITIRYKNTDRDQSSDMGKRLTGKIEVRDIGEIISDKYKVKVEVKNGESNEKEKEVKRNESATFTVNSSTGYTSPTVTCTNNQKGSIEGTTLTVANVTNNTECTVNYTKQTYTITYSLDGGSVSGNPTNYDVTSSSITLKNPSKTGYTFTGWTGSNGSTPQTSVTIPTGSTGNKNYTANYKANTYKVEYNSNGGIGTTESSTHTYDESKTLTKNSFTKTGYTFLGWSTNKEATSATYTDEQSVKNLTTTNGETITLYAIWKINTYDVNVVVNNGTTSPSTKTVNYNTNATFTVTPTTGYHYSSVSCTNNQSASMSGTTLTVSNVSSDTTCTVSNTVNTYKVKYNANGGSGTMSDSTHTYGVNKALSTNTFTRSGYVFAGWSTSTTSSTVTYTNGQSVKNLTTTNNGTVNLYAVWKRQLTVTFNVNGASSVGSTSLSCTVESGTSCSVTAPSITASSGFSVVGWNTSSSATTSSVNVGESIEVSSNITYYAITKSTSAYTVTFEGNGATLSSESASCYRYNGNSTCNVTTPSITRSGYTINGYNTSASSTTASIGANASLSVNGNKTYYAVTSKELTATFYRNGATSITPSGGSASTATSVSQTCTIYNTNTSCNITSPSITKSGWTIIGWGTSASSTTKTNGVNESIDLTSNINRYAVTSKVVSITYNANSGSGAPSASSKTIYNTATSASITLSSTTPTRTGYTFLGWAPSNSESSATYNAGGTYNFSESTTIYAVWKINTYKVNVTVLNGIVEGETSKEVNYQEDTTFTVNASSGYGEPIVSCTNGQSGSISETTLTVSNVTNNTTCTVTYKEIKKGFETIIDKYTENNAEGLIKINQPATSQTPALTEYRYTGKAPKNYVTFNNELWRIIGVFEVDDGTGNYEQRIKIMRGESIGNIGWDYNENGPWSGSSTATLNTYLNGTYYNELSEEVRSMISESKWYTAVINADQTTPNIYIIERGSDKGNIEYGNINWTGKIALAYLSDYGYASSNCYNSSNTLGNYDVCTSSNWLYKNFYWWTIGVAGRSSAMVIDSSGYSHGMRNSADAGVLPTLYLKSNVAITGGEGTSSSPYEISL